MKKASLYFHLPFCTKKCPYCHFYVLPNKPGFQEALKKGLALEWEREKHKLEGHSLVSIYFGGGTPSLFTGFETLLEKIPLTPSLEITIEANPDDVSLEKLQYFRSLGINRLSLGVQSLDDRSLQTLERIHSAAKAKEAIHLAKKAGFNNITIDLMYDLPDQTENSFRYTLDQLEDLDLQHVSLYNLTIEPQTAFHKRKVLALQGERSLRLLQMALTKLEKIGLKRYEISAFAQNGFESKHNIGYWTARPFLGLGPSAFSYFENSRYRNVANLNKYLKALENSLSPVDFSETLPYPESQNELLAIQLRLKSGIDLKAFTIPEKTLPKIEKLKNKGLLIEEAETLKITEKGMLFYDTLAEEII